MSFWPDDITEDELRTPREILQAAADELGQKVTRLHADIVERQSGTRITLSMVLTCSNTNIQVSLFEVLHEKGTPYPALIDAPTESMSIPTYLQREQYIPGKPSLLAPQNWSQMLARYEHVAGTPGRWVENEWVCATPAEFSEKLTKLLARDDIKVQIVSLLDPHLKPTVEPDLDNGDD